MKKAKGKLQKVALHEPAKNGAEGLLDRPLSAKILGYARVSTEEQSLSVQLEGLTIAAFTAILNGTGAIVVTPGHSGGYVINFEMPRQIPAADDNQPF